MVSRAAFIWATLTLAIARLLTESSAPTCTYGWISRNATDVQYISSRHPQRPHQLPPKVVVVSKQISDILCTRILT